MIEYDVYVRPGLAGISSSSRFPPKPSARNPGLQVSKSEGALLSGSRRKQEVTPLTEPPEVPDQPRVFDNLNSEKGNQFPSLPKARKPRRKTFTPFLRAQNLHGSGSALESSNLAHSRPVTAPAYISEPLDINGLSLPKSSAANASVEDQQQEMPRASSPSLDASVQTISAANFFLVSRASLPEAPSQQTGVSSQHSGALMHTTSPIFEQRYSASTNARKKLGPDRLPALPITPETIQEHGCHVVDWGETYADWIKSYSDEQSNFRSIAVYCQIKLKEIRSVAFTPGLPNTFRTAVCCDLLDKMILVFSPFREVMIEIRDELMRGIFADWDRADCKYLTFLQRNTFSDDVVRLNRQKRELELYKLRVEVSEEKRIKAMNSLLHKFGKMQLRQAWTIWSDAMGDKKREKHQRKNLSRIFARVFAFSVREAFTRWREFVGHEKGQRRAAVARTGRSGGGEERASLAGTLQLEDKVQEYRERMHALERDMDHRIRKEVDKQTALHHEISRLKDELDRMNSHWSLTWAREGSGQIVSLRESLEEMREHGARAPDVHRLLGTDGLDPPLLIHWFNHCLDHANSPKRVRNLELDVADYEALGYLVEYLTPETLSMSALTSAEDIAQRHLILSQALQKIGCPPIGRLHVPLKAGDTPMNTLVVLAELYRQFMVRNTNTQQRRLALKDDFTHLSLMLQTHPSRIMIRWVNYILMLAASSKLVTNLDDDFKDSEVFVTLLAYLDPTNCRAAETWIKSQVDMLGRATVVVECLKTMGLPEGIVKAEDIVKGNITGNQLVLTDLFLQTPALVPVSDSMAPLLLRFERMLAAFDTRWRSTFENTRHSISQDELNKMQEELAEMRAQVMDLRDVIDHLVLAWEGVRQGLLDQQGSLLMNLLGIVGGVHHDKQAINTAPPFRFSDGPRERLQDVLVTTDECRAVEAVVRNHTGNLVEIFKWYSITGAETKLQSAALSDNDFAQFWIECQLEGDRVFPPGTCERLYRWIVASPTRKTQAPKGKSTLDEDAGLCMEEFVEALTRISSLKYSREFSKASDRLMHFLDKDVFPNARRTQVKKFLAEIATPNIQNLLSKHHEVLMKTFSHYTGNDLNVLATNSKKGMRFTQWIQFNKDSKVILAGMSQGMLQNIFEGVQSDEAIGGLESADVLSYGDFLNAVSSVAACQRPDPFVPLVYKIDAFIEGFVTPNVRAKQTRPQIY